MVAGVSLIYQGDLFGYLTIIRGGDLDGRFDRPAPLAAEGQRAPRHQRQPRDGALRALAGAAELNR
jgi:hypothetical protein